MKFSAARNVRSSPQNKVTANKFEDVLVNTDNFMGFTAK